MTATCLGPSVQVRPYGHENFLWLHSIAASPVAWTALLYMTASQDRFVTGHITLPLRFITVAVSAALPRSQFFPATKLVNQSRSFSDSDKSSRLQQLFCECCPSGQAEFHDLGPSS